MRLHVSLDGKDWLGLSGGGLMPGNGIPDVKHSGNRAHQQHRKEGNVQNKHAGNGLDYERTFVFFFRIKILFESQR